MNDNNLVEREKYISLFVDESKENLIALNDHLLELERGAGDLKLLNDIFRVAHTLKGMAATLGFHEITELSHEMENMLDALRNAQLAVTTEIIDVLFLCLDTLDNLVENVNSEQPKKINITNLIDKIRKIISVETKKDNTVQEILEKDSKDIFIVEYTKDEEATLIEAIENGYHATECEVILMKDCMMKSIRVLLVLQAIENKAIVIKTLPIKDELFQEKFGRNFIVTFVSTKATEEIKADIMSIAEVLKVSTDNLNIKFKNKLSKDRSFDTVQTLTAKSELFYTDYTETEKNVLLEAISQDFKCYEIYVNFMENCMMRAVRATMVFNTLSEEIGAQLIRSLPPSVDVLNGDFKNNIIITVISNSNENLIRDKLIHIGEIKQVEVLQIGKSHLIRTEERIKQEKIEIPKLTDYEKLLILEASNFEENVFLIRVNLMPNTIMKYARYVLVSRKIEKFGRIIKTLPSQEDLESENFDDSFELLIATELNENKILEVVSSVAEVTNIVDFLPIALEYSQIAKQEEEKKLKKEDLEKVHNLIIKEDKKEEHQKIELKPKEEAKHIEKLYDGFSSVPAKDVSLINPLSSASENKDAKKGSLRKQTIRIDTERLDNLINMIEELVIFRGRLNKISSELLNIQLTQAIRSLSVISNQLQNTAMSLRMVPIETVFNRFPRMIRDIAKNFNKEINFLMEGQETELDRTVIDEIGDPLVHILRNAADHGIETPEERLKLGKDKVGNIKLSARHEGNNILIMVEDDGRGINTKKVIQKALEKGFISQEQANVMTTEEALKLIFIPGLSTSEVATDISGRGVGMDAVIAKLKSIGGNITIFSEDKVGTRQTIKLPLTLAIMEVLLVRLSDQFYAIPITYIEEVRELSAKDIKTINKTKVIIVRDKTIPLIDLGEKLNLSNSNIEKTNDEMDFRGLEEEVIPVVIVRTEEGKKTSGLIVDSIITQEDVVIKPLGKIAKDKYDYISGTANLGDGSLALILNITNLTLFV